MTHIKVNKENADKFNALFMDIVKKNIYNMETLKHFPKK